MAARLAGKSKEEIKDLVKSLVAARSELFESLPETIKNNVMTNQTKRLDEKCEEVGDPQPEQAGMSGAS